MANVLFVSIAIGDKYLKEYNRLFRPSHENYARTCGYDFRVVEDFLDEDHTDKTTVSLNKILVCSQPWSDDYDYIVYVDADVLINIRAPPILAGQTFGDKIGIVNEYDELQVPDYPFVQRVLKWGNTASEYYAKAGFNIDTDVMLNTGVMVFQPKKHREFLDRVYNRYIDQAVNHFRSFHFEQSAIGYEMQMQRMYIPLNPKFNAIWFIQKALNAKFNHFPPIRLAGRSTKYVPIHTYFHTNYFMHLAGHQDFDKVPELQKNNVL
jgi:hypothetical protein